MNGLAHNLKIIDPTWQVEWAKIVSVHIIYSNKAFLQD